MTGPTRKRLPLTAFGATFSRVGDHRSSRWTQSTTLWCAWPSTPHRGSGFKSRSLHSHPSAVGPERARNGVRAPAIPVAQFVSNSASRARSRAGPRVLRTLIAHACARHAHAPHTERDPRERGERRTARVG